MPTTTWYRWTTTYQRHYRSHFFVFSVVNISVDRSPPAGHDRRNGRSSLDPSTGDGRPSENYSRDSRHHGCRLKQGLGFRPEIPRNDRDAESAVCEWLDAAPERRAIWIAPSGVCSAARFVKLGTEVGV